MLLFPGKRPQIRAGIYFRSDGRLQLIHLLPWMNMKLFDEGISLKILRVSRILILISRFSYIIIIMPFLLNPAWDPLQKSYR